MLLPTKVEYADVVATIRDHAGGDVVQLGDLPTARRVDATSSPCERVVGSVEFEHRLSDPDEVIRTVEVSTEQLDDPVDVAIEDREPLLDVPHGEVRIGGRHPLVDLTSHHRQAAVAQRCGVSDGVGVEEVLVVEAEPDHPLRQRLRVGDTGVTELLVDLQQSTGDVTDRSRRVIGVHDHLDHSADCQLDQLEQLTRRGSLGGRRDLVDDDHGVVRPRHRLAVVEVPASPQRVELGPQGGEAIRRCRGRQSDRSSDVAVPCRRLQQEPANLAVAELFHEHVEFLVRSSNRRSRHDPEGSRIIRRRRDRDAVVSRCRSEFAPQSISDRGDCRSSGDATHFRNDRFISDV